MIDVPVFDTKENVTGNIGSSSTICDGHVCSPARDRVGKIMGESSLGYGIGIAANIPDRQLRFIDSMSLKVLASQRGGRTRRRRGSGDCFREQSGINGAERVWFYRFYVRIVGIR